VTYAFKTVIPHEQTVCDTLWLTVCPTTVHIIPLCTKKSWPCCSCVFYVLCPFLPARFGHSNIWSDYESRVCCLPLIFTAFIGYIARLLYKLVSPSLMRALRWRWGTVADIRKVLSCDSAAGQRYIWVNNMCFVTEFTYLSQSTFWEVTACQLEVVSGRTRTYDINTVAVESIVIL
jgi:hypothetical protein